MAKRQQEAPELTTPRLLLRGHEVHDLDAMHAMWADERVHGPITGRPFTREEVWQRLLRYIGHWRSLGVGNWLAFDRTSGRLVGEVGHMDSRRAFEPPFEGTLEVGWALCGWAHGQGYGEEALGAALDWGDRAGVGETVCIIKPGNAPSIRLAVRVGYSFVADGVYQGAATNLYRRGSGGKECGLG